MELTNELILDAALIAGALVFAVIGFLRGVQREVFSTAAILGGWAMASAWTDEWADNLANLVAISTSTAGFVITAAFLLGSLALLGWGAGSSVGALPRSVAQRAAGGVLGGINGVLFASYGLETWRDYLADSDGLRFLAATDVARVVLDELPYAIAIGMALAVLLTIAALALGGSGRPAPLPAGRPYPSPARKETVTVQEEGWKVEPTARKPGNNALDNTMPIAPVDPARFSESGGKRQSRFRGGDDREWVQIEGARAEPSSSYYDDDDTGPVTTVSCVSCGRAVTLADVYCPWCGKLTR